MIDALIPLGNAIIETGAHLTISHFINNFTSWIKVYFTLNNHNYYIAIISVLYFLSMIFSSFLSNAAVAIVFTPIAIALGNQLGIIDPRQLVFAFCLG